MIGLITSEAVELVDDEIIDGILFIRAEANSFHEFGAIGSLGGFSFFHEYFQDMDIFAPQIPGRFFLAIPGKYRQPVQKRKRGSILFHF